jgi:hypothetical protein
LLQACTSTYTKLTVAETQAKLETSKSVAIATPANGSYEAKEYVASGQQTAAAVRSAFAKHVVEVTTVPGCAVLSCLTDRQLSFGYFVVPEILHWEDRATEWSGIKDKLEVKLTVHDAKSGRVLASTVISGKSKWMTFGGDHPQDLLAEPIDAYVNSLY